MTLTRIERESNPGDCKYTPHISYACPKPARDHSLYNRIFASAVPKLLASHKRRMGDSNWYAKEVGQAGTGVVPIRYGLGGCWVGFERLLAALRQSTAAGSVCSAVGAQLRITLWRNRDTDYSCGCCTLMIQMQ